VTDDDRLLLFIEALDKSLFSSSLSSSLYERLQQFASRIEPSVPEILIRYWKARCGPFVQNCWLRQRDSQHGGLQKVRPHVIAGGEQGFDFLPQG
jgi:hypothetical protein